MFQIARSEKTIKSMEEAISIILRNFPNDDVSSLHDCINRCKSRVSQLDTKVSIRFSEFILFKSKIYRSQFINSSI